MAKLSLNIRKAQPNVDGSYNIKVMVSAKGNTCYLSTRYNVSSVKEWKNGKVVGRYDAAVMNRNLATLLLSYENIIADNPCCDLMSHTALRDYILRKSSNTEFVKDFMERFIGDLEERGQTSYASNMGYTLRYLLDCFGDSLSFKEIDASLISRWEKYLVENGSSMTTVNIRMTHLKAILNAAVDEEIVSYKVFPFRKYKMPEKTVRDLCIDRDELLRIRDAKFEGVSKRRMDVARDLFMLSFYCAGINLTDIVDADWSGDKLRFVRKKTQHSKRGEKTVSMSITPEARRIADVYMGKDGRLNLGYNYADYGQFRSFVTKSLNRMGEELQLSKRLMFYTARKTFCQFGFELGIPLYILEYAIGHTIKDAANRPIYDYIRIMERDADTAIRSILDYVSGDTD